MDKTDFAVDTTAIRREIIESALRIERVPNLYELGIGGTTLDRLYEAELHYLKFLADKFDTLVDAYDMHEGATP